MNPLCEGCPVDSLCKRHKMYKSPTQINYCKGIANIWDGGLRYWNEWESGGSGATAPEDPQLNPGGFEPSSTKLISSRKVVLGVISQAGVGTEVKKLLSKIGIRATSTCNCNKHVAEMDRNGPEWCRNNIETILSWMSEEAKIQGVIFISFAAKEIVFLAIRIVERREKKKKIKNNSSVKILRNGSGPPVEKINFVEPVRRNLLYHIYPMKNNRGIWQWNLDQLIQRIDLFTGKRIVGIVHDNLSDSPEEVKDYLHGYVDNFVILKNNKKLGEGITYESMMERIESFDINEITFRAHAKGVSKNVNNLPWIKKWIEIMYAVCLDDWQFVKSQLGEFAVVGPFRCHKRMGGASWFFSGAFYWFRNRDVFQRNWKLLQGQRVGIETWPHDMFWMNETGCLFNDETDSLYEDDYINEEVWPKYRKWLKGHIPNRVIVEGQNRHPKWISEQISHIHSISDLYYLVSTTPSDICEHCTTLKMLASNCKTVTEFGTRYGISTIALLAGEPTKMVSYDTNKRESVTLIENVIENTDFQFVQADTLKSEIDDTDLLFIDTLHTYDQLKAELNRHASKVNRYIIMHDTVTFGIRGEDGGKGLKLAIDEFLSNTSEWAIKADFQNNNGLMVLERNL